MKKGGKKKRKNERIISKISIGPSTSNSDYLTSDRNDTKGYEHFNSYLGHIVLFNYKPEFFIGRVARENYENYKYFLRSITRAHARLKIKITTIHICIYVYATCSFRWIRFLLRKKK